MIPILIILFSEDNVTYQLLFDTLDIIRQG